VFHAHDFASRYVQIVAYTAIRPVHPLSGAPVATPMVTQSSHKRAAELPTIPDRLYFKIGDVARICGVETYVLRFWETQFPPLKPNKSGTGQRLYRRRDVELVLEIKRLVHDEGYTIAGARQSLEQGGGQRRSPEAARTEGESLPGKMPDAVVATIGHARAELRALADLLAAPVARASRPRTRLSTLPVSSGSLFPVE